MWIVWIESKRPYMWAEEHAPARMSGLLPLTEPALPVERIEVTHPQAYPQERGVFVQSTYWGRDKSPPISGGVDLWIFPAYFGLLHSEGYLSTKNRELSTVSLSRQGAGGNTLPPPVAANLYYSRQI